MSTLTEVQKLFLDELAKREVTAYEALEDGRFAISINDATWQVSLDNISREFEHDRDPALIEQFVETIFASVAPLPDWAEAKERVRFCAEPSDLDFGHSLKLQITESLCRILVYADPSESTVRWLTPAQVETWGQQLEYVEAVAEQNMASLLSETEVQTMEVDEFRLGILATGTVFKASLIFAPNLKEVIGKTIGWPLLAVIPCRDFAYFLAEQDSALVPSLGEVVMREFTTHAYPISTEIFRISDDGIEAIGAFATEPDDEESPEGMRFINYRGGVVKFLIPDYWEEEYDEDGGGTFYAEEEDSGTLRLNVLSLKSQSSFGPNAAVALLQPRATEYDTTVVVLDSNSALLSYVYEVEEDGEQLAIFCWQIANLISAEHARVALFSYTVLARKREEPEIQEDIAMLNENLRKCVFSTQLGE